MNISFENVVLLQLFIMSLLLVRIFFEVKK